MKRRYLILTCLVLWATTATAQIDPNDNGIGIYADLGGMANEVQLEAGTPLEVYLLLTRPTGALGLAAWECQIVVPDNVSIWGWNLPISGSVAVSSPPSFCVGLPDDVPYQTIHHLMTIIITPLDCHPAQFFIEEFPNSQGVTAPRYFDYDGTSDGELINLTPYPAGGAEAAFTINPEALPVSAASWDEVKALYR